MLILNHLSGFGAVIKSQATATHTDYTGSLATTDSYSFSSRAIGAATTDRVVVVIVQNYEVPGSGARLNTYSIGGVGATLVASEAVASYKNCAMFWSPVSSGTTATIAVTYTASCYYCYISVYTIKNQFSSAPYWSGSDNTSPNEFALDGPNGGALIAGCHTGGPGGGHSTGTTTWTSPLVEDQDEQGDTGAWSSAHYNLAGASLSTTIGYSNSYGDNAMVAAYWR